MSKEQLQGYFWKVTAKHMSSGNFLARVTDERGVELMKECGYFILRCEKVEEAKR